MSQPLTILTETLLGSRSLFRPVVLNLEVRRGEGRLEFVETAECRFSPLWKQAVTELQRIGQQHFELAWQTTDLVIGVQARSIHLDGRSACLPLFVAWVSLLVHQPLPAPFFGTGVATADGELLPAPARVVTGKLGALQTLVERQYPGIQGIPVWLPAGSEPSTQPHPSLDVHTAPSVWEAAERILGLTSRARAVLPAKTTSLPSAAGGISR